MKRLSDSLENLAGRVAVLEDSATASFEADKAKLETRRQEIEASFNRDAAQLDSAIRDAEVAGRTWWNETKESMRRPLDEVRARHETRKSEHELKRAVRHAEAAEEDAAAAIEVAAYFVSVAEYAVIDAALARLAADDLAGEPSGKQRSGASA